MGNPNLTPELVTRRLKSLKDVNRIRDNNMLSWRELYFRTPEQYFLDQDGEYVEPEPDEFRTILPIAQQYVDTMLELLLTKSPAITVPAPSARGQEMVQADHNEKALFAVWHQADIYREVRDSLWHGFVDGWGVLQLIWDKNADSNSSPIVVVSHDPINVYAAPGWRPGTWQYVIHAYPKTVAEVREEWEPKVSRDKRRKEYRDFMDALEGLEDGDRITYIEYWDDEFFAVAVNFTREPDRVHSEVEEVSRFLHGPEPHRYGFLPWEIYYPNPTPFRRVAERAGISILYVIEDLIRDICVLVSKKETMLHRWQDPPLITKTEDGRDFEPVRGRAGLQLKLLMDEDAHYLVNPTPMPQLDTHIALLQDFIERGSLPRVLQGQYVGSVSGIAMSLLRNPTLMKVAFKQDTLERTLGALNEKILRLLEKFLSKPRYLWGQNTQGDGVDVMVDPKRIGGYYRNEVKLSASLPTDDANTVNMIATLVQLQILSKQTARDVMQQTLHELVPQSLPDEQEIILAELMLQNPETIAQLAQAVAQKVFGGVLPGVGGQAENPRGGLGEREVTMPARTLPSQVPGMPGGNTEPNIQQRIEEMLSSAPQVTGETARVPEAIE